VTGLDFARIMFGGVKTAAFVGMCVSNARSQREMAEAYKKRVNEIYASSPKFPKTDIPHPILDNSKATLSGWQIKKMKDFFGTLKTRKGCSEAAKEIHGYHFDAIVKVACSDGKKQIAKLKTLGRWAKEKENAENNVKKAENELNLQIGKHGAGKIAVHPDVESAREKLKDAESRLQSKDKEMPDIEKANDYAEALIERLNIAAEQSVDLKTYYRKNVAKAVVDAQNRKDAEQATVVAQKNINAEDSHVKETERFFERIRRKLSFKKSKKQVPFHATSQGVSLDEPMSST